MKNVLRFAVIGFALVAVVPCSTQGSTADSSNPPPNLKQCILILDKLAAKVEGISELQDISEAVKSKKADLEKRIAEQDAVSERAAAGTRPFKIKNGRDAMDSPADSLIQDLVKGWLATPSRRGGPKSMPVSEESKWTQATFSSLALQLRRRPQAPGTSGIPPLSLKFRNRLADLLARTIRQKPDLQAVVLSYGLDGNGARTPAEIAKELKLEYGQVKSAIGRGKRSLNGKPGIELMKLIADEIGEDLREVKGVGWVTSKSLAAVYRDTRAGGRGLPNFEKVPMSVLGLPGDLEAKLRAIQVDSISKLADYFRDSVFKRQENTVPFTRDELVTLYRKTQPVIWPGQEDLDFLKWIKTSEAPQQEQ